MNTLKNKEDIIEFYKVLKEISINVTKQLLQNYDTDYCYTHVHIDIDMLNNSVDVTMTRSKINAQ